MSVYVFNFILTSNASLQDFMDASPNFTHLLMEMKHQDYWQPW